MSALAWAALDRRIAVTGSDLLESPQVGRLRRDGADIVVPHGSLSGTPEAVIFSSAVADDNPELNEARRRCIPVIHRSQLLAALFASKRSLAVAGSHGKTSVSSLLAWILIQADLQPAYAVGGLILGLERNGGWGKGNFLVAEADESDGSFCRLSPDLALVTGVELDHVRRYPDLASLREAFAGFVGQLRPGGTLIFPEEDSWLRTALPASARAIPFGSGPGPGYRMKAARQVGTQVRFDLTFPPGKTVPAAVPGFGRIAAVNALAAAAAAGEQGVPEEKVIAALATYPGVARRLEVKLGTGDIRLIEDYAHHPTEVAAAVAAVRGAGGGRLVVVFEPHRYSRLKRFHRELAESLLEADEIVVAELYGAFEPVLAGIDSGLLARELESLGRRPRGPFSIPELDDFLPGFLRSEDTALLMGAGRITGTAARLQAALAKKAKG